VDYGTLGTLAGALVVGLSGGFLGSYVSTRAARAEGERQREHDRAEAERQPSAREADLVDAAFRGAEIAARAIVDADAVA
jgi:hypothetical protein